MEFRQKVLKQIKNIKLSKDYIDYIVSKGIKEDVISIEMNGYEKVENGFLVNTKEIFIIQMVQRKERDLNLPID